MNEIDQKWLDALKPYLGGGIVPIFFSGVGEIDAEKTIEHMCMLHGISKQSVKEA